MSEPTLERPRQVTLAAGLIMGGSLLVIGLVFDRVAGLHTLETRESVERFLSEPPGSDLGVGVDGVLTAIQTIAMVTAGCATAAAILGYHVLRRSRSARLALTVLAVPLFLSGLVTGGFVSSVVAAASVMLWLQPARDWFRGLPSSRPSAPSQAFAGAGRSAATSSTNPVVRPAEASAAAPASAGWPDERPVAATRRPAAVVWACWLTWVCSAVAALGMVASAVAIALEPDTLLDEARRQNPELAAQGVSDAMLTGVAYAMVGGIVLWCLSAIGLAVLVFRRVEWARVVLIVSAATAAALSLLGSLIGAFLLVLPLIASIATIALLVRPDTRPWFRQR